MHMCETHRSSIKMYTQIPNHNRRKANLQNFSLSVLLITDTAAGSAVMKLGSIHNRARYLPLLDTMTGLGATQPHIKGLLQHIP